MSSTSSNMKKLKFLAPIYIIFSIVIAGLTITALPESQSVFMTHLLICILVFVVFMLVLFLLECFLRRRSKDNYDVNESKDAEKGGKENKAYDLNEGEIKKATHQQQQQRASGSGSGDQKWISNYVPYGDYPKGNVIYVKEDVVGEVNGHPVEIINGGLEKQDMEKGDARWQQNYVPYEEDNRH